MKNVVLLAHYSFSFTTLHLKKFYVSSYSLISLVVQLNRFHLWNYEHELSELLLNFDNVLRKILTRYIPPAKKLLKFYIAYNYYDYIIILLILSDKTVYKMLTVYASLKKENENKQ